ncbi:Lrp/AsnC family transcriptional regulator [Wenjunlia tyrosinilytica]|uniref:AsnC family transcriptional regulator n=1 Tax=Wenjunlia tyrosinilytica TaxID=1544741 RepID=A0A918E1J2_9ACTN|nr:Lrp/AsnC family transcriptional regulator [Wenjunlia tyrosinilytica]GGO96494.1 AsnC family transcriptional regulator [Wenjunlia tyrosinilytica]
MAGRPLDDIDKQILDELTRNARIPHAELADRVLLSRNAVRQRVERLERDGHIQGYTIVPGEGDRAAAPVAAMIFVHRHDRVRGGDVIMALRRMPDIVTCDVMSGELDLVLRVETARPDRIQEIWSEISALPGVRDTVTSVVLSTLIGRWAPVPPSTAGQWPGAGPARA